MNQVLPAEPFDSIVSPTNEYGEQPIEHAPKVVLANSRCAVPQQFLSTCHTTSTLEAIVLKIDTPEGFLLFVGERNSELFLQVGIIGCENYPKASDSVARDSSDLPRKIVYGRRWLIEKTSPSSEVIQTANLAVKKAREHELREKVFLSTVAGQVATPFNCHMDLPLMASNSELFPERDALSSHENTEDILSRIRVSDLRVCLTQPPMELDQAYVICLDLMLPTGCEERHFPDLEGQRLQFIVKSLSSTDLLQAIMDQLISLSDRYVDAQFTFDGFKRFDRSIDPSDIAAFSISTRRIEHNCKGLAQSHADFSYQIDSKRVPPFSTGALGARQRRRLLSERNLCGHLPNAQE